MDLEIPRNELIILDRLIDQEIATYQRYSAIIDEERANTVHFSSIRLAELSLQRDELCSSMRELQEQRRALIKKWCGSSRVRLRDFVNNYLSADEAKLLLPKVEQLREVVRYCQKRSDEFGQVVNFSLNVVSGLISILWSATQNVVRSYTAGGKIKESYHSARSRAAGLIKQA